MTTTQANPGRPPKHWMRSCIKGVTAGKSAADPGAVCGSLWHHKLSESQRRAILKEERAMGGLVENPRELPADYYTWLTKVHQLVAAKTGYTSTFLRQYDYDLPSVYFAGVKPKEGARHLAIALAKRGYDENPVCPCENPRGTRLNDHERELWVLNDSYLYGLHKESRQSMRAFLKENRDEIDAHIRKVLDQPPRRDNPSYAENPPGSAVLAIAAALGLASVVAWLVLRKPEEVAKVPGRAPLPPPLIPRQPPAVAACEVDTAKLHVFAQAKGLLSVYLPACPAATPPVQNQPAPPYVACWDESAPPTWAALWTTILKTTAPTVPIVLVLRDGSFWTYGGSPPVASVRTDLRAEYCQFAAGSFTFNPDFFPNLKGADPGSLFIL